MEQIFLKFILKSKKCNDQPLVVYLSLYNEENGLMQFPIDLDKWEVLDILRFIGKKDINGNPVYEKDRVKFISLIYNSIPIWQEYTHF